MPIAKDLGFGSEQNPCPTKRRLKNGETSVNKYSLRNLKNAQIYFNAPISFNDPFNCSIVKESVSYSNEDIVKLFNHYFDSGNLPRQYPIAHSIKMFPLTL